MLLSAEIELPPIARQLRRAGRAQPNAVARRAADTRMLRRRILRADEVQRQLTVDDAKVPRAVQPAIVEGTGTAAATHPSPTTLSNQRPPAAPAHIGAPVRIEPAQEEHSGHVTLYLPKGLNQWLAEHRDRLQISYPNIVLNAISWAVNDRKLEEIFAPEDSPIPANDIFGRAPVLPKTTHGGAKLETRPLRFSKGHMREIITLAGIWTADNRNAFFVGVLNDYRDHMADR